MKEPLDHGLEYLERAKEHAEGVAPCYETGMVFYIEVNLLTQKYETSPTDDLKTRILKTAELAIAQFGDEREDVKIDYQRMLILKMVFCYLGISLLCKKLGNVTPSVEDLNSAEKCLTFVEKPEVWDGMENRRKMLFYLAKSVLYQRKGNTDIAKIHAKEAVKIARKNGWRKELPHILAFLAELKSAGNSRTTIEDHPKMDALSEFLPTETMEVAQNEDPYTHIVDIVLSDNELAKTSDPRVTNPGKRKFDDVGSQTTRKRPRY